VFEPTARRVPRRPEFQCAERRRPNADDDAARVRQVEVECTAPLAGRSGLCSRRTGTFSASSTTTCRQPAPSATSHPVRPLAVRRFCGSDRDAISAGCATSSAESECWAAGPWSPLGEVAAVEHRAAALGDLIWSPSTRGTTSLTGPVFDPARLPGVLIGIRDLGVPPLTLRTLDGPVQQPARRRGRTHPRPRRSAAEDRCQGSAARITTPVIR
jgi:hypothetical protein